MVHAAVHSRSVPKAAQIAERQSSAPWVAQESPRPCKPPTQEPRIGAHWYGQVLLVPSPMHSKPVWQAWLFAVQPAPGQVPTEQSLPQNVSPWYDEPAVRFTTQREVATCATQSSSLEQAAQSEPSVSRLHLCVVVLHVEPRPHSRTMVEASVPSQ